MQPLLYQHATDAQLRYVSPIQRYLVENFDARIQVACATNTRELTGADPARQALQATARGPLLKTFMQRGSVGALRWTVAPFPTDAYAQEADMSLAEYEDFVYGACLADTPDPMVGWQEMHRRQQILIDWLQGKRQVHLIGPDTDLWIDIAGRSFANCDGHFNMPTARSSPDR